MRGLPGHVLVASPLHASQCLNNKNETASDTNRERNGVAFEQRVFAFTFCWSIIFLFLLFLAFLKNRQQLQWLQARLITVEDRHASSPVEEERA